jgi:leader peptidase (prepilin peptidase)/N-methyltransferase
LTYLFLLGAMVGSFLNVVIARLPTGESVVRPRSKCPKCGDMIPAWLNIPILSWLVLRGHCRACKTPISIRYPMVELLTAFLFLAAATQYGQSLATLSSIIICAMLVAITFIDIDIWEIPDEISLPGILIGCALRPFAFDVPWYDGLIGAALGASFLWLIRWVFFVLRDMEGMGLGDVKLIATIGAFVGPLGLMPTVLIASVSGTVIGSIVLFTQKNDVEPEMTETKPLDEKEEEEGEEEEQEWQPPKNAVPFGPFLSLGAICTVLFGDFLQRFLMGFSF